VDRWKLIKRDLVYRAKPHIEVFSDTVALPDGRVVEGFHHIALADYAAAVTETADGRFLLIRQYKHGVGGVSLTLCGGGINAGEDPLRAAQRELLEEAGYEAPEWTKISELITHANQRCAKGHIFHARGARKVAEPNSGDLEDMEVVLMPRDDVRRALQHNEVKLASAMASLALVIGGIVPSAEPRRG
jgi:ADP-ribose pyrophosphatase